MNMRPGKSNFPRPDGQGCKPGTVSVPCSSGTNTGTCTPDINCVMGTNPGRTHRFFTGNAVIPFGHGLSYTSFNYDIKSAPMGTVSLKPVREMIAQTRSGGRIFPAHALVSAAAPLVQYEINVTNTGTVDSDDAVLGFLKPPGAGSNGVPVQQLYGFERVHVQAGKSVVVSLYPELTQFTQVDAHGERYELPGEYTFGFGVSSQRAGMGGMGYAEHTVTVI